jgi:hypothetical protein
MSEDADGATECAMSVVKRIGFAAFEKELHLFKAELN